MMFSGVSAALIFVGSSVATIWSHSLRCSLLSFLCQKSHEYQKYHTALTAPPGKVFFRYPKVHPGMRSMHTSKLSGASPWLQFATTPISGLHLSQQYCCRSGWHDSPGDPSTWRKTRETHEGVAFVLVCTHAYANVLR